MKTLLHKIMALPLCYDLMQRFFGVNKKKKILSKAINFKQGSRVVLDVGGGTGLYKDLWPDQYQYICLDYDLIKLSGFSRKYPDDSKLCSDAARMALKDNSVDYVFCSSVSHHIHEDLLEKMIKEMHRVLDQDGCLIFIDAVKIQESRLNRWLWSLDRGEFPHTYSELENLIGKYFQFETVKKFSFYYDYVVFVANKKCDG